MEIEDALASLPSDSPFRDVIRGMAGTDPAARAAAHKALKAMRKPYWEPPDVVAEEIAVAVLAGVLQVTFAPPARAWDPDPAAEIVFTLIGSAHPAVVELVAERFARAEPSLRLVLLTLVASAGTRRGAEVLASLVERHGWPERRYARFFSELHKNVDHAEALFPTLLEVADGPTIELGDMVLVALRRGTLRPERIASTAMVRGLPARMADLVEQVRANRGKRRSDEVANTEGELAMLLDLAAYAGAEEVVTILRRAADLEQKRPAAFAVASLLRRKEAVPDETIARLAADPAVRVTLYALLRAAGATERIPAEYRSRDAFAEADMVQWLSHAGELGCAPDAIELMTVFEAKRAGEDVVLYVWRFRGEPGVWKASVSGVYPARPPEGPLQGDSTFSRFDDWSDDSADGHARAILDTLSEWAEAHAKR